MRKRERVNVREKEYKRERERKKQAEKERKGLVTNASRDSRGRMRVWERVHVLNRLVWDGSNGERETKLTFRAIFAVTRGLRLGSLTRIRIASSSDRARRFILILVFSRSTIPLE